MGRIQKYVGAAGLSTYQRRSPIVNKILRDLRRYELEPDCDLGNIDLLSDMELEAILLQIEMKKIQLKICQLTLKLHT